MKGVLLTLALMVGAAPALAHQLSVFAAVEGDTVLIEAAFADGRPVQTGTLRILDAAGTVILDQPIAPPYPVRFPIGPHRDGLRIEVDAGGGHDNYWLLTPADLAHAE